MVRKMLIILGKSVHDPILRTFGIYNGVHKFFHSISWENYFVVDISAYIELIREFYITFKFYKPLQFTLHTPNLIFYRLRGQH